MSKHTPGPWEMRLSDNATPFILHGKDAHLYDIDDLDHLVCVMPAEIMRDFNSFANANLIAAAPEMLEALKHCYDLLGRYEINRIDGDEIADEAASIIRSAITKATGEVLPW
jgi:hypothetical protein